MKTVYTPAHLAHAPAKEFLEGQMVDVFEKPSRAEIVLNAVKEAQLGDILAPKDFGMSPIHAIHNADYLDYLQHAYAEWIRDGRNPAAVYPDTFWKPQFLHRPTKRINQSGIYMMDLSVPITGGTWHAVYQSAQTALSAAELVHNGERAAFGLCRPPGHHSDVAMAGGYCFINNAAVTAQWLREQGAARVSILDIDVHHGNGTQSIFYARSDVQFVSLHGAPDWQYPYFLGGADERGAGEGLGCTANYPLPRGANDAQFLAALNAACNDISQFAPQYLVVSLGLDTYEGDPIGGLGVSANAYAKIGALLAQLRLPTAFLLEGGYAIAQLGTNAANVLLGFEGREAIHYVPTDSGSPLKF